MNGMVVPICVVRWKSGHNKKMNRSREAGRNRIDTHLSPPGDFRREPATESMEPRTSDLNEK